MTPIYLEIVARDIREQVNDRLHDLAPEAERAPEMLHAAMRYSLLGGGKRIRPMITMLTASHFGADRHLALDPACAIEMVHTASLILDDLPSMDDATMRRGRPANHVVFGEDTAQLASIGLLNGAFEVLCRAPGLDASVRVAAMETLTNAVGSAGMIAGQMRDLEADVSMPSLHELVQTNALKTGTLFVAGAEIGARVAGVPERDLESVRRSAGYFGLAFQLLDDILDASGTVEAVGKDVGQDANKQTCVSTMGIDSAREMANECIEASVSELASVSVNGQHLIDLARSLQTRHLAAA